MEHRLSSRIRTLLQARVVFNDRFSLIECTVKDLSDSGAQVTFAHPVTLPEVVELEIPKKGLSTQAKVMWSNGKNHGLKFLGEKLEQAAGPGSDPTPLVKPALPDQSPSQESYDTSATRTIQDVLEEARQEIAQIAGVSETIIRLKLEIEY